MTVSERIPFSGLLLPLQKGYTYVFASFNSIMVGVLMVAIAVYVCVGLPNMNPSQLVLADMFSSGTKLTTLGAGIAALVFVMLFAIVITSTGATFGVLMTLFSFANCLGDIVLCIIPFFLRKKYPHACRHAGFTMPLWVLYAMSVFAIVVAAYLSYSALLTLGATVWLLLAIFAVVFVAYVLLRIAYLKRQGRDLMAELKAPLYPLRRARGRVRRHGRGQVKKLPILTTPYIESTPADHPPGCFLCMFLSNGCPDRSTSLCQSTYLRGYETIQCRRLLARICIREYPCYKKQQSRNQK